jgi:hypothetical protein
MAVELVMIFMTVELGSVNTWSRPWMYRPVRYYTDIFLYRLSVVIYVES